MKPQPNQEGKADKITYFPSIFNMAKINEEIKISLGLTSEKKVRCWVRVGAGNES
jgi:hypothetical protein